MLAKLYPAYTHDDIFYLENGFAMSLIWKHHEEQAYNARRMAVERQIQAAQNKTK